MSQSSSTSVSGDVNFADTTSGKSTLWILGIGAVVLIFVVWLVSRK